MRYLTPTTLLPIAFLLIFIHGGEAQSDSSGTRLVRYSGQVAQQLNSPGPIAITFSLFQNAQGGRAIWSETQNVGLADSKFTVLLGSSTSEGLPVPIFASREALWLEWHVAEQLPGARTQLVSVPYALSSANAETFAGHPLSDFVLTDSLSIPRASRSTSSPYAGGVSNMLAKFSGDSQTTSSQVYDNGTSVGIGTATPSARLEVAGDLKISGPGSALVFADGTRFTASSTGGISAKAIEQVRFADQFAAGSVTGGIAEAYADCPATGCKVQLGSDVNITSPQVIAVANGKPLVLDLAGRVLKVSNQTGIGLTFTSENINTRTPMTIMNGTLQCSFSQPNLIGFAWRHMVNASFEDLDVRYCNTPGSVAVLWDWVQDAHMNGVGFRNNAGALRVQNASNQVSFHNVWFDSNIDPVVLQDNGGVTFEDCLIQSNTGARAIQIVTSAGNNATTFRVHKCHFENNGDMSALSRNIYIAPAASQYVLGISVEDNVFTAGAFGALGTSLEVAGSQNVAPVTFKNNQYNGYARGKVITGLRADARVTAIGENLVPGDSGYDVGINTHGLPGISFAPESARRAFQLFAGSPGNYDGYLQFWDSTANASILNYSSNSSSWTFPRTAVFNASVAFNNAQNVAGFSDNQQTQTWGIAGTNGSARFDGGIRLGGSAAVLATTEQTGSGSIVMSNDAHLTSPDLGDARAHSLALNGETMSHSPRMVYSAAIANPTVAGLQARWTLDQPIVVTRFQFVINNGSNSGCTSAAVLQITDGTNQVSLALQNGQAVLDSGSVNVAFPAGANLDVKVSGAAIGCSTVAISGNATVQYRMQ